MFFKQIKTQTSSHGNFSYLIADEGEAVVVDPSFHSREIMELAKDHGWHIKYVINTHQHHDHTAGNGAITARFGAKVVAHRLANMEKDIGVVDGDTLRVGGLAIKVIHTPGHSPDSISLLVENKLLTGDTLFVEECGRTDLPGGSAKDMYHSLFHKLMTLDDAIEVYPGHDYGSKPQSTIGVERRTNYTLEKRTLEEFIEFMKE